MLICRKPLCQQDQCRFAIKAAAAHHGKHLLTVASDIVNVGMLPVRKLIGKSIQLVQYRMLHCFLPDIVVCVGIFIVQAGTVFLPVLPVFL